MNPLTISRQSPKPAGASSRNSWPPTIPPSPRPSAQTASRPFHRHPHTHQASVPAPSLTSTRPTMLGGTGQISHPRRRERARLPNETATGQRPERLSEADRLTSIGSGSARGAGGGAAGSGIGGRSWISTLISSDLLTG